MPQKGKKTLKRKSKDVKIQGKSSENGNNEKKELDSLDEDSGAEDLANHWSLNELNNVEDSSDEEPEDKNPEDSDGENDEPIFDSGDENDSEPIFDSGEENDNEPIFDSGEEIDSEPIFDSGDENDSEPIFDSGEENDSEPIFDSGEEIDSEPIFDSGDENESEPIFDSGEENDNEPIYDSGDENDSEPIFDSGEENDDLSFESSDEEEAEAPSDAEIKENPSPNPEEPSAATSPSSKPSNPSKPSKSGSKPHPQPSIANPPLQTPSNEYEYDSSDEEDIRNTVGNIPMKWYDDYPHIGYTLDGKKLLKPSKGDQIDAFLKRMEDPDFWRSVKDPTTGQEVILSEEDINLIKRIQKQEIPDASFDDTAPWVEWFTSEVMKTPLRKFPEHKRSFIPSKNEAKKVSKLVHALKMGWIKSTAEMEQERLKNRREPQFYMLWQSDDQSEEMRRIHKHIPAPKRHLPGHAESYNPPPEYLFDKKELKQWNKLKMTPWKRKLHFIPQKFNSLREVPSYSRFIKERFQRCLDLYLCPRALKMKLTIDPETLVPQLPSPRDLQPFPTTMSMIYKGHEDMVRSISCQNRGQYFASGGDDMKLRIFEISTGRCVKAINCGGIIRSVAWCPNEAVSLIAVAADKKVLLINPGVGDHLVTSKTDKLMEIIPESDVIISDRVKTAVQWEQAEGETKDAGIRVVLNHFKIVKQVTWHPRGDYFATVMPDGENRAVLISQLSKRRSQLPFTKPKGLVQCVLFHPIKPIFFVATQRHIRVYDLKKQEMIKKLLSNSQWISTMAIHPGGDNVLVGTYDRKMLWFDMDLSTKPYQTLRLHGTGVRGVAFHKRYPLFASGADDRGLIVSHGMVYNDLLQNPLIVPLKRFSNHEAYNDFGILDVTFHPIQPWVFSAGADSTIRMYT